MTTTAITNECLSGHYFVLPSWAKADGQRPA